jgi:cis-3-alkyl-4-acyloxetan-2-one decarboxylase
MFDTLIHRWLRIPYRLKLTEFHTPKKPRATVVLLHGIGNSAGAWNELIPLLPTDIRIIGVDLLGFGVSPKPGWAKYNTKTQANAVVWSLAQLGLTQKPIVVGHSLGSLVAIELAKRYPLFVRQLVLCSPPLYAPVDADQPRLFSRDRLLRRLYHTAKRYPGQLIKLSPLTVKLGFATKTLNVNDENISSYMATLEASIINQTSLADVERVKAPMRILYGAFDPVVIGKNIKAIATARPNVTARRLLVGHDVVGQYTKALANEVIKIIQ